MGIGIGMMSGIAATIGNTMGKTINESLNLEKKDNKTDEKIDEMVEFKKKLEKLKLLKENHSKKTPLWSFFGMENTKYFIDLYIIVC